MKRIQNIEQEQGRSMVEMLGVLAIIGVLSVSGIAGYTYAMNKHRANEIVASVSKMAMTATTEIDLRGQPSLVEFKNLSGQIMTDGGYEVQLVDDEENGRFQLKILKVPEAVCENVMNNPPSAAVFTYAGADGTASECAEDDNTLTFVFNDSMSDQMYASDYTDSDSCTAAGKKWCSKINGTGGCVESDCCADTPACKTCNATTGALSNAANYNPCDSGAGNGIDGICYRGNCYVPANGVCVTQDDCGGAGSGYYCSYGGYKTYNTEDPEVLMGCTTTNGVRTCKKMGECLEIRSSDTVSVGDYTVSNPYTVHNVTWWSAKNFCTALNKNLLTVDSLQCFKDGDSTKPMVAGTTNTGYCCASGQSCPQSSWLSKWDTNNTISDADAALYGAGAVDFRKNIGWSQEYWTASPYGTNSSRAFIFRNSTGEVGYIDRYDIERQVMCR